MRGKWTEGPWKVECGDHTHRFVLVTDNDDRTIYYKYGAGTAKAADQDEADARLIAAAPALYEALHLEVRNCPVCKGDGVTNDTLEHILGHIPASEKVECSRCKNSRAALSLAHTEPSQGEK